MTKFMTWLEHSFAPAMTKLTNRPWIAAISSSMQRLIPYILAGCMIFFYDVFRGYLPFLPDLGKIADYTFGMLGILTAFLVTNQVMEKLRHPGYSVSASLMAISVYIMFSNPSVIEEATLVDFGRLGPSGILVGMIAGIFVSLVFHNYAKLKFLKNSEMPDFIKEWVNTIFPILISVSLSALAVFYFKLDMFNQIISFFSPLQSFGQTLPGFILIVFIPTFFYTLGISSWLFGPVSTPIYIAGITANIAAVEAGQAPLNIATNETVFTLALITMGGMGATLVLNIMMMRSKSKRLRTIGKICIGPSIFNINEPVMFGAPVVLNPLLMLPAWIATLLSSLVVWGVMRGGLLNIPSKLIFVGQIPPPISTVMATEDWRGLFVFIAVFIMFWIIWLPFFKVYEKQVLAEEAMDAQG